MKEKIRRLALGIIDTNLPVINVTPEEIEETISYGKVYKAEIHLKSENQLPFRGLIYSSNPRVELSQASFSGFFAHIAYTVDTSRVEDGEDIVGSFSLVTNAGEFVIPYTYSVKVGADIEGDFNSLEGFVKLTFADRELALTNFTSPDFVNYPFMRDMKIRAIYSALIEGSNAEEALDEFLFATGAKNRDIKNKAEEFLNEEFSSEAIESISPFDDAFESEYKQAKIENRGSVNKERKLCLEYNRAKIDVLTKPYKRNSAIMTMQSLLDDIRETNILEFDYRIMEAEIDFYKKHPYASETRVDYYQALKKHRRCFEMGCRSPYLYIQVCSAYRNDIELLREFDEMTLSAISFGSRHGLLNREIAIRLGMYAARHKYSDWLLYTTIKRVYHEFPERDLLEGIVNTLINYNRIDEKAFEWYKKATEEGIRLTKLYEYLLLSAPEDFEGRFTKDVYAYFGVNNPLGEREVKLLYNNIVNNFTRSSSVFRDFEDQIYAFVIKEMLAGNIDSSLAPIYSKFLTSDIVDDRTAKILPTILQTKKIIVPKDKYKYIVITYEEIEGEQKAAVKDDEAVMPIYTNRFYIFGEDVYGNRYLDEELKVENIIKTKEDLLSLCESWEPDTPSFLIKEAHRLLSQYSLTKDEKDRLIGISNRQGISPVFKTKINEAIIKKYDWKNHKEDVSILTEILKDKHLSEDVLIDIVVALVDMELLDDASVILNKVNYEKLDLYKLLPLSKKDIEGLAFELDSKVLNEASFLFANNIYDNSTLTYLCKYFNGLTDDMKSILFKAIEEGCAVFDMPERLLAQMLFADIKEKLDLVFEIYARNSSVQKSILMAYYVIKSYRYFIEGEEVADELFEAAKNVLAGELLYGTAPIIMQLAISKFLSTKEFLDEPDEKICKEIVGGLFAKGIVFPYFKKLTKFISLPEELLDKTIVTFFGKEEDSVALIIYSEDDAAEPIYMDMTQVCAGIFVRTVLLYDGEYAGYEIRVTRDGKSFIADEGELTADVTDSGEDRKFVRLNSLVSGSADPSSEEWQRSMEAFAIDDNINKLLFEV